MSSADTETTGTDEEETEEVVETDEAREALLSEITERLGDGIVAHHIDPGNDLIIRVANGAWAEAALALRRSLGFDYFTYLSAIDWLPSPFGRSMDATVDLAPSEDPAEAAEPGPIEHGLCGGETRFQVLARVYSTRRHLGVTLKADVASDDDLSIETWTGTYPGADWHERESWEMFGITFTGHPGLRKLYLPHDFEGFPLRKDFPLLARQIKPWPGIVDVEPMPDEGDGGDDSNGRRGDLT